MLASRIRAASERKEPENTNHSSWGTKAWDSYEYRRGSPRWLSLTEMGADHAKVQKAVPKSSPAHVGRKQTGSSDGSNDSSRKSKEITTKETKVPLKIVGVMAKDKAWLQKFK